jgi:hypothetical protein
LLSFFWIEELRPLRCTQADLCVYVNDLALDVKPTVIRLSTQFFDAAQMAEISEFKKVKVQASAHCAAAANFRPAALYACHGRLHHRSGSDG